MELMRPEATIRLPRQLDAASVAALARDLAAVLRSESGAVVLRGAEPEVYCAGLALDADAAAASTQAFADVLGALHGSGKPTLALVDGQCIGGGLGLAAACDWVVATDRATFALPELLWGLVPAIIWPVVAGRMAPQAARRWTLTAWSRPAWEALAAGLVDDVVPADGLDRAAERALRMLARVEPDALRHLRDWARTAASLPLDQALARGAALTAGRMQDPAVRRRRAAFAVGEAPWSA
jgi:enoyl-CoA hydratase/carnithine racemase